MTGLTPAVTALIAAGRIEEVPADPATARLRLRRAEEKLEVARQLATIDTEVAYVTAYDAVGVKSLDIEPLKINIRSQFVFVRRHS